jgi:predicted nucleotidyltransferase
MLAPNEEMRLVARRLIPLDTPFAFIGGAVMYFLVDHPELTEFRRTKDVDVVVAIVTYSEFAALEERLRDAGFAHDISEGAPICRWIVDGCRLPVDIMPQEPANLGMNTRWFPEVLRDATDTDPGEGCAAKVITPPLFLATKLEAFKDRGQDDFYGSHDLEDIVTLVDGRANIVVEMASAPLNVRNFVAKRFAGLLRQSDFLQALPGHLSRMLGARERAPLVKDRFEAIARL